jgi:hypothetical protein
MELETLRNAKEHYKRNERSAMAAVVEEMAKPVLLSDFDRVGFIRMRKVASTAVHFFLAGTLHYEDCLLSQCLYSTGVRRFTCPEGKIDPYQCNHDKPYRIQARFESEKAMWQNTASVAHLKKETAQAHTCTHIYTHIRTHIHTHTHTHTHAHTHIHTHIQT